MNDREKEARSILGNLSNNQQNVSNNQQSSPVISREQEAQNIISAVNPNKKSESGDNTNPLSTASNAIKDVPVLGGAYRILGHSLIGGVAEPITSIFDLAARPFGHLSKYTTRPILNAEEKVNDSLDKDDQGNEIYDYGNKTALPSEVGSFAASFIPVVRGTKFLNWVGNTVKRFTNPKLYKTEQDIKNTLGNFQSTVKQSAEQGEKNNIVGKSEALADSLTNTKDLETQLASANKKETIREEITNSQQNSQNILDTAHKDAQKIKELSDKLGDQYSKLEKLHKDLQEIKPGISSNMADFFFTGKKGYGIGQGMLVGGMYGASDADQANPQAGAGAQIATGALIGGLFGGATSGIAHGLQTYLMNIGKKAQQTITPNENRVLQSQRQTEPSVSPQVIEDTIHNFPDHDMEDMKKIKSEPQFINEKDDSKALDNAQKFIDALHEKYKKATDEDSPDRIIIDSLNSPSDMQKQLGYGLSITHPESRNSYSKQFAQSQSPIFNALNVKDLETANDHLAKLYDIVDKAYKAKNIDEVPLDENIFNYMRDAVDENRTREFEQAIAPIFEKITHSTNAYKALTDAENFVSQNNFDNLTDLRSSKAYKNLSPYAKARFEHEINIAQQSKVDGKYPMVAEGQEENHEIGLSKRALKQALQNFNKNANGRAIEAYKEGDNILNKYHQIEKELKLPFANEYNGSAIPISKITDIKRLINNKGAYDADPHDKEFYFNYGHKIRDYLSGNQDEVVHAYRNGDNKSEVAYPITSMMAELHKIIDAGNVGKKYGSDLLGINNFDMSDMTTKKIASRMNMQSKALDNLEENINKLPSDNVWGNIIKNNLPIIKHNSKILGEYSEKGSGNNLDNRASQDQSITPMLFMNSEMLKQRNENLEKAKELARIYNEQSKYLALAHYLIPHNQLNDHIWANIHLASQHIHPTVGGLFSHLTNSFKKTKESEAEDMNSTVAQHLAVLGGENSDIKISNHPEMLKMIDGKQTRTQIQVPKIDKKTSKQLKKTVSLKDANTEEIGKDKLLLQKLLHKNASETKNFQTFVKQDQNAQKVDAEAKMQSIKALHKYLTHPTKWTPETISTGITTGFLNGARNYLQPQIDN